MMGHSNVSRLIASEGCMIASVIGAYVAFWLRVNRKSFLSGLSPRRWRAVTRVCASGLGLTDAINFLLMILVGSVSFPRSSVIPKDYFILPNTVVVLLVFWALSLVCSATALIAVMLEILRKRWYEP